MYAIRSYYVLAYLIEHRDRVVSANELLDSLWSGVSVTPAALSRTVGKARRAVGDDGERQAVLRTEHGPGLHSLVCGDSCGGFARTSPIQLKQISGLTPQHPYNIEKSPTPESASYNFV